GESFSEGSLAPGTLLIVSDEELSMDGTMAAIEKLEQVAGVESISAQGHPVSDDGKNAKFSVIFKGNPYDAEAFKAVQELRAEGDKVIQEAGLDGAKLFVAGESAKNTDLRDINKRDSIVIMSI